MCAITGIFNLDQSSVKSHLLKEMTHQIGYRGPDDEGYFIKDNIGLGHKRLSIIDTSKNGSQPMFSNNKKWVIVFNGCIYNFKELRKNLEKLNHKFKSNCDTEVIAEGIDEYGINFVKKFNGMFAIAAWNQQNHTLYLIRDRYGIKPLYYWFNKNILVFASEIKAILKHPQYRIKINYDALNQYFTFQNIINFDTLFLGIKLLAPANIIKITEKTIKITHNSWWDYNFNCTNKDITYDEAKKETQRLLEQAVNRQSLADVAIGSYLSGGMDSGSIVAIASKIIPRLTTFTAGFELSRVEGIEKTFDERRDAELIANYYKTEHYEQVINAGDLAWSLPRVVWHLEDLRLGMSYPNYYISRLASKFVKVCFQGTGGDELYAGYPWRYYHIFRSLNQEKFFHNYYNYWQRLVNDEEKNNFFNKNIYLKINHQLPANLFKRVFTFNNQLKYDNAEDHINNSLYFEIKTFLHGNLLVGDKLSMANSLEERFPFLDNDLVNFAQIIPIKYKLGSLQKLMKIDENEEKKLLKYQNQINDGKSILRDAMIDYLPTEILRKNKQGFSSPEESWYRGENFQYVKSLLLNKSTKLKEFINNKYLERILNEHLKRKKNHRLLIWSLINFEWWLKLFIYNEHQYLL